MIKTKMPIYLASKSPRRKKLLEQINLKFKIIHVESDEKIKKGELPAKAVMRISKEKLHLARKKIKRGIIITADTVVVINNKIIGKPVNEEEAFKTLKRLSGKTHSVYTGFSIYNSSTKKTVTEYDKTLVTFRKLNDAEIKEYITTGSPMDKAGAYGIQDDFGAVFIKKINGCYYNVVGLPLAKVYELLNRVI